MLRRTLQKKSSPKLTLACVVAERCRLSRILTLKQYLAADHIGISVRGGIPTIPEKSLAAIGAKRRCPVWVPYHAAACWRQRCWINRSPSAPSADLLSLTVNLIGDSGHHSGQGYRIGFRLLMQSFRPCQTVQS
jgi:hypothetical protein